MIQYLKSTSHQRKLKELKNPTKGSWVRLEKPTDEELEKLFTIARLDEDVVYDALDPHEVPRLEVDGKNIYFITRLPDTDDDFNDFTTPILFVINTNYIMTVSSEPLSRLWTPFMKNQQINTTLRPQTFIMMMEAIVTEYQRRVAQINRQMRAATDDITRLRPQDIAIFVEYERKLNDYLDALIPSNDALERVLKGKVLKLGSDDQDLIEDVSIDFVQMIARCKSLLRTITNVRDSYRAVMDTRLNETMRLLTVITLSLTFPTMIAGLYGMNVELPGHETSPVMFWIIAGMAIFSSGFIAFYFLKKRP